MYLYWFERIVRKQSGMYDWAIPYWDWTNAAQRALPATFRDSGSLLYDATRNAAVNAGNPLSTGLATSVANAMTLLDYFNTQSSINGPHGSVHVSVGGNMGSTLTAAQDPIFWAHHAQVDRLWNLWLAQGGGRSSPVGNATWRNTTYTFFDECCEPVRMKGCDILRAAAQLSYAYEGEPPQVNQYCPLILIPRGEIAVLTRAPLTLSLTERPARVPLLPPGALEAGQRLRQVWRTRGRNVVLQLRNVEAATQPGISWEVHVGPRGFTPSPRTLIGVFALFGAGLRDREHHYHPAEFAFPVGRAARAADPGTLEVTFVPTSGLAGGPAAAQLRARTPVTIGEIAVFSDEAAPPPPREEQERLRREEQSR